MTLLNQQDNPTECSIDILDTIDTGTETNMDPRVLVDQIAKATLRNKAWRRCPVCNNLRPYPRDVIPVICPFCRRGERFIADPIQEPNDLFGPGDLI